MKRGESREDVRVLKLRLEHTVPRRVAPSAQRKLGTLFSRRTLDMQSDKGVTCNTNTQNNESKTEKESVVNRRHEIL